MNFALSSKFTRPKIGYNISSDGERIILLTNTAVATVYETFIGNELFIYNDSIYEESVKPIYAVGISNNGQKIIIVNWWHRGKLIDVAKNTILQNFDNIYIYGAKIRFSSSDEYALIVTGGAFSKTESIEGEIHVIDLHKEKILHTLFLWDEMMSFAEFSPDNKYIIAAGFRLCTLSVWDVETGTLLVTINNESSYVYDIEFSPDGTKVVTLHEDGFSRMWDFSAFAPSGVDDYSLYR